jgi:hypothetical protein
MLIHDAILEFLICGNTRIMASGFSTAMDNLNKCNKQTGKSGYETQFEVSLSLQTEINCYTIVPLYLGVGTGFTKTRRSDLYSCSTKSTEKQE